MCTNTDVWLDGDFISTFTSLVCHNNHSLVPTALMESAQDVPQLTYVTYPNSHMTINDYKALQSSVKGVVAVMHTRLHYAVMEMTIDTQTIKIFDGLYQPILDWKDHVTRAMRKGMLVDPFVVPASAQFNADTAVYEIVGRSRKPKECVNRGGIHKKISGLEKKAKKVPRVFFQNWCSGTKTKVRSGCRRSPPLCQCC